MYVANDNASIIFKWLKRPVKVAFRPHINKCFIICSENFVSKAPQFGQLYNQLIPKRVLIIKRFHEMTFIECAFFMNGRQWPRMPIKSMVAVSVMPTGDIFDIFCHWNHTGWCWLPVVLQWQSSANLHNWNTETPQKCHWKTTGSTLETHWLPIMLSPVAFQYTLGS